MLDHQTLLQYSALVTFEQKERKSYKMLNWLTSPAGETSKHNLLIGTNSSFSFFKAQIVL